MAVVKRTVRRKVTKVWDRLGEEHLMPILNARDMVTHNQWTLSPPVIRYVDKAKPNVKAKVEQIEVPSDEEEEDNADEGEAEDADEGEAEDAYEDDEVDVLNPREPDATDQVEIIDEVVQMVPLDGTFVKAPSTIDPSTWTKDQIIQYAQDNYKTKLNKQQPKMTLEAELMKLVEALG